VTADIPDVDLSVPARPEYVGVVRHLMGAVARLGGHSPEFVENAKLAGSEACTNAVTMSGRAGSEGPIEVRAQLDDDRLEIWVADGGSYEEATSPEVVEPDSIDVPFDRGLSLPLLEGLVDKLEVTPRPGGGTLVQMTLIGEEGWVAEEET
jgi:serine/threonine-protein kinase RsbW